jgi:hypothetical protein
MGSTLMRFDSREQGRIVVDRVTRNYLVLASRTLAAADPEHNSPSAGTTWPGQAMNGRFPPSWMVEEREACFVVRDHNG